MRTASFDRIMRLPCQKALLLVVLATIGCSDTTDPIPAGDAFVLHSVNGRTLPTPLPTPIPEAPTILSGSITLHEDGNATLVERRRGWGVPTDQTSIDVLRYSLDGDDIHIEPDCPDTAICALIRGVLINGVLSIDFDPTLQHDLIYEYRRATE